MTEAISVRPRRARIMFYIRSGLVFWLLDKAMSIAPAEEKLSLARAVGDHCDRTRAIRGRDANRPLP